MKNLFIFTIEKRTVTVYVIEEEFSQVVDVCVKVLVQQCGNVNTQQYIVQHCKEQAM